MRPKSMLLLVMALGCGLVAAVGINQILATPSNDAETTNIVVARREILKGDLLKPDDIRLQEWRIDALPPGAIQKIDDLVERRVKHAIVPGEPILDAKLVPKGQGGENPLPAGMKAVAVRVDAESGGAGLILPGDNVDVMLHVEANASKGIPTTLTKVLLKNVKVHAVDDVLDRPDAGQSSIAAKTVSLVVSPHNALLIGQAIEMGKIRLVMRSAKDDGSDDDVLSQVTPGEVLGNSSSVATESAATPLPPTGPAFGESIGKGLNSLTDLLESMKNARNGLTEPEEKPFTMKLIEGSEAKEVEFSKDSRSPTPVGGGLFDSKGPEESAVEETPNS